jgi:hypothetical protein
VYVPVPHSLSLVFMTLRMNVISLETVLQSHFTVPCIEKCEASVCVCVSEAEGSANQS